MQSLAGISLLLLLPWSVFAAAETLSTPDCELFYAVFPNRDAAGTVEKKVFETVSGLAGNSGKHGRAARVSVLNPSWPSAPAW